MAAEASARSAPGDHMSATAFVQRRAQLLLQRCDEVDGSEPVRERLRFLLACLDAELPGNVATGHQGVCVRVSLQCCHGSSQAATLRAGLCHWQLQAQQAMQSLMTHNCDGSACG
jgi:hypothetical protein